MRHGRCIALTGFANWRLARVCCRNGGANQQLLELAMMLRELRKRRPKVILEIGVAEGGSLHAWSRVAHPEAILVGIDPHVSSDLAERVAPAPEQKLYLIQGTSKDRAAQVEQTLNGRLVDFLFIDGDHTYEGVSWDFAHYGRLMARDSLIALHDIQPHAQEAFAGDVPRFWQEVKQTVFARELIEHPTQQGYGIGLVFTGQE